MARKIDYYINRYSISKTLRFSLFPVGRTTDNFMSMKLLDDDRQRAENYKSAKRLIDEYHRDYINRMLSRNIPFDIKSYSDLYYKTNKSDKDKKELLSIESKFRKQIADRLKSDKNYDKLFKKKLFIELLPGYVHTDEDKKIVDSFDKFVTYFSGYFENRKNMYSDEAKSTAIAYRCINDNLSKFLDNCRSYRIIKEALSQSDLDVISDDYYSLAGVHLDEVFDIAYFSHVLSQNGIEQYNNIIGGYTNTDQTQAKVKGLNEIINLHNQKTDKKNRLPKFKMLFKQILSDQSSISFIPESFDNDNEVLKSINDGYIELTPYIDQLYMTFESLDSYNRNGIYIKREYISAISQKITGNWNTVTNKWNSEYDDSHLNLSKPPKNMEKYYDKRKTAYSQIDSFSIGEVQRLIGDAGNVINHYSNITIQLIDDIRSNYKNAEQLLINEYNYDIKLAKNDIAIDKIKSLLDNIKELERTIKQLMGTGKEVNKNEVFYGEIQPAYDYLREFDRLYDKVRNYITKKPYSKDKIKLNFQNPQFLNGWDVNKEKDYQSFLLRRDGKYFVAILNHDNCNKIHKEILKYKYDDDPKYFEKIIYKQIPDAAKYISIKQVKPQNPSNEILNIFIKKKNKVKLSREEEIKIIDYSINEFLKNYHEIIDSQGNSYFDFKFQSPSEYESFKDFCEDVERQAYAIQYKKISEKYILDLVDEGKIYLFQIYNKDFSEYSRGTPNLHTLYFKMLFDERNLKDVVYKLSGGAEMFYRFPSLELEETAVHKANQPLENKNELSGKKTSVFGYDLVKDRRFTKPQFSLHVPITLNFKSQGLERCNEDVKRALRECEDNYVIGIDRGERNLLYVCVINGRGEIVEQYSLNEIVNESNGMTYKTDYHKLLDKKEEERDKARKNWSTIEGIKELKEGYISQVIHKICDLVVKYDAIIAMEDLNMGFKQSRIKVEKQVYQKFEKMLIDKLNYLVVDKNMDPEENGGLLNAYQLTEKFTSFAKMGKQNGFIFYVPPYLTSKIDPVTGFVDLLKPKYENIEKTKNMISNFDFVRYNAADDMFEFGIDYTKVERGSQSYLSKWIVCTNGERIRTFHNKDKNNEWDNETVILTNAFMDLFDKHGIVYSDDEDIKNQLLQLNNKDFFREFTELLKLTLQMRNSKTGTDIDYLISPVRDKNGKFYNSNDYNGSNAPLPENADANGAYNIARKALWCIDQIKAADDDKLDKVKLAISNKEWLEYVQKWQSKGENPIAISNLNDFIFCPASIYFHSIDSKAEKLTFQDHFQLNGSAAHEKSDNGEYSDRKDILQAIPVYCEKYNIYGKIDTFNIRNGKLTERKKKVKVIYDGDIFQVYAQYFALSEMGYKVNKIVIYSMDDNRSYNVPLSQDQPDLLEKFEKLIVSINSFTINDYIQGNTEKSLI